VDDIYIGQTQERERFQDLPGKLPDEVKRHAAEACSSKQLVEVETEVLEYEARVTRKIKLLVETDDTPLVVWIHAIEQL